MRQGIMHIVIGGMRDASPIWTAAGRNEKKTNVERCTFASAEEWGRDRTWASAVGVWRIGSVWEGGQIGAATTILAPLLTMLFWAEKRATPHWKKPQYRAGSGAQGQIYLCFIIRHASCDVGVTYVKADGLASINDPQNVILKHVRYCLSSRELPASGTPTSRGVPGSLCSKRNLATPSPSNWQTCKQRKGLAVLPPSCQNQKNCDHRALARLTGIRFS